MAQVSALERPIDAEEDAYVSSVMSHLGQEAVFKSWVALATASTTVKERILVVTRFRVVSLKVGALRRSVRQNYSILDLENIEVSEATPSAVSLQFLGQPLNVACPSQDVARRLVQAVLAASISVTKGMPTHLRPRVQVAPQLLEDWRAPSPDSRSGLLATYLAHCDREELRPRVLVLDCLMRAFGEKSAALLLQECFTDQSEASVLAQKASSATNTAALEAPSASETVSSSDKAVKMANKAQKAQKQKVTTADIAALTRPLHFTDVFDTLVVEDMDCLDNDGLAAVAGILGESGAVTRLHLAHLPKCGSRGFSSLALALQKGRHRLHHLSIEDCAVGSEALQDMCNALHHAKQVLQVLVLNDVGLNGRSVMESLVRLLNYRKVPSGVGSEQYDSTVSTIKQVTVNWPGSVRVLDLSRNCIGRTGSQVLGDFLRQARSLETLVLAKTDLDTEEALRAVQENAELSQSTLKHLDLSGNKLTKSAASMIADIVRTSTSLRWLVLRNVRTAGNAKERATLLGDILCAALQNKSSEVRVSVDLSDNDLGTGGTEVFAQKLYIAREDAVGALARHHSPAVKRLYLENCNISAQSLESLVDALLCVPSLEFVSLNHNVRLSRFGKAPVVAGQQLARLVRKCSSLRALSVRGDGDRHALKTAGAIALVQALAELDPSSSSLTKIDLSGNRLEEDCLLELCEALKSNTRLRSVVMDENRTSLRVLKELKRILRENHTLVDPAIIPMSDVDQTMTRLSRAEKAELKETIISIETAVARNMDEFGGERRVAQLLRDTGTDWRSQFLEQLYGRRSRRTGSDADEAAVRADEDEDEDGLLPLREDRFDDAGVAGGDDFAAPLNSRSRGASMAIRAQTAGSTAYAASARLRRYQS